jgi:hypothetical protein
MADRPPLDIWTAGLHFRAGAMHPQEPEAVAQTMKAGRFLLAHIDAMSSERRLAERRSHDLRIAITVALMKLRAGASSESIEKVLADAVGL